MKLDVEGQGGGKILDVDGQGGRRVLKIGQFSWTSYVYTPLVILEFNVVDLFWLAVIIALLDKYFLWKLGE